MPRLNIFSPPLPKDENRSAIEQRARQAATPVVPKDKGKWPFPIRDLSADDANGSADSANVPDKSGPPRERP